MPIPWAAQQQDAELLQELAGYDIGIAAVGLGQSLLHLQRQLILELGWQEDCTRFCTRSKDHKPEHTVADTKRPQSVTGV